MRAFSLSGNLIDRSNRRKLTNQYSYWKQFLMPMAAFKEHVIVFNDL
jgi:hypothetical protein